MLSSTRLKTPLRSGLLMGVFQGKDTITVKVIEVDGIKKLDFEVSSGASGTGELLAAGSPSKN